jgi:hypothetical protein
MKQLNALSEYEGQRWERLEKVETEQLLQRAIRSIKRERQIQANGKNGWLVTKQRR